MPECVILGRWRCRGSCRMRVAGWVCLTILRMLALVACQSPLGWFTPTMITRDSMVVTLEIEPAPKCQKEHWVIVAFLLLARV